MKNDPKLNLYSVLHSIGRLNHKQILGGSLKVTLLALTTILLLSGCEQGSDQKTDVQKVECQEYTTPDSLLSGEKDPIAMDNAKICGTISLWAGSMPKSLNSWLDYNSFSSQVMGLMFEGLVGMHTVENKPVGHLAESWDISEDGKTYTFKINPAARWSDGKAITAEDVQFYYDVIMDEKNLTPIFRVGLKRFERPEVVDSLTIKIKAKTAHWGNFWEAAGLTAFPKHVWKDQDFNKINFDFPVVSGPYKIGELKKDRYLELERREDWWGRSKAFNKGKYNFSNIRFRFMNDRIKTLEALKKGDLDLYPVYTSKIWVKQTDFESVKQNHVVRQSIYNKEPIGFQGFAINLRRSKFQDVQVRKALQMLLNRELMNDKYMFNQYFLLNSFFPDLYKENQNPAFPVQKFDPKAARALLQEAGYTVNDQGIMESPEGEAFHIEFMTAATDLRHITRFQEDLKSVGIQSSIRQLSQSTIRKRLDQFDYDLYWVNWGASRLRDPESMWHSSTADNQGSNNLVGFKNPLADSLIEAQKTIMDMDKRNEILKQLDSILVAAQPYVFLWQADLHRLLYWNRFGTPTYVLDKFNREDAALVYWWLDPEKDAALQSARQNNSALPTEPEEVHWKEPANESADSATANTDDTANSAD